MATMKTLNGYGFNATELNGKASNSYLQKTDTASDSAKLGGKAPEYYLQPRNLLDNSDFRNPVNQRGKTSYTTDAYCIDRWMLGSGEAQLTASGIKLTGSIFRQPVPLQAGTYTFAVHLTNGTTLFVIFQYDGSSTFTMLGGTNETTEAYINVYNYATGVLMVQFAQGDSSSVAYTLAWAALYEGSYTADTLPPYVPKEYATELAECRWTYIPFANNAFLGYVITNGDGVNFQGFIPISKMRATSPAVQGTLATWDGTSSYAIESIHNLIWQGNGFRLNGSLSVVTTPKSILVIYAAEDGAFVADL